MPKLAEQGKCRYVSSEQKHNSHLGPQLYTGTLRTATTGPEQGWDRMGSGGWSGDWGKQRVNRKQVESGGCEN